MPAPAPDFLGQARLEKLVRGAFRRAYRQACGGDIADAELDAWVRKEIPSLAEEFGQDFLLRLTEPMLPAPEKHDGVPVDGSVVSAWLTPGQRREAESALWFAKLHGIDSIVEVLEWHRLCNRAAVEAPTLRVCVDRFILAKRSERLAPTTVRNYFLRLERVVRIWGDRRPGTISEREVQDYLSAWSHPTTKRAHWLTLSAFFNWLMRQRYILRNPVTEVVAPKRKQAARLIFTPEEAAEIMRRVRETDAAGYWALSLFAGLRASELRRIQQQPAPWRVVDWDRETIDLAHAPFAYGQNRRSVALVPSALEWLRWMQREGKPFYPVNYWEKFRQVRAQIMASRYPSELAARAAGHGREFQGMKVYAMARRSYVSYRLALEGVSYAHVSDQVGMSEHLLRSDYYRKASQAEAERYFQIRP